MTDQVKAPLFISTDHTPPADSTGFPTRLLGWEGRRLFILIRNLFPCVSFDLPTISPAYPDPSVGIRLSEQESDFRAASIKRRSLTSCCPLRRRNLKRNAVWLFHCQPSFRFKSFNFHRGCRANAATSAELCKEGAIFFFFCVVFSTNTVLSDQNFIFLHILCGLSGSEAVWFAQKQTNMVLNVIVQSGYWAAFILHLQESLWKRTFKACLIYKVQPYCWLKDNTVNKPKTISRFQFLN